MCLNNYPNDLIFLYLPRFSSKSVLSLMKWSIFVSPKTALRVHSYGKWVYMTRTFCATSGDYYKASDLSLLHLTYERKNSQDLRWGAPSLSLCFYDVRNRYKTIFICMFG